jgi:O-antigen/teichoic acid export membrane protein
VLNIILIWYLGIVGAAVATTVSFAVNTLLHARFLSHHIDIDIPYREAVWSFVSSIIMGIIVYLVRLRMEINSVIELLAIVLIGIVVYSALIIMFSSIRIKLQSMARSVVS